MNKFFSVVFKIVLTIAMVSLSRYLFVEKRTDVITKRGEKIIDKSQESQLRNKFLRDNQDILDMPPWEHENKWHRISNSKLTCWYHKQSKKKICQEHGES